MSSDPLDKLDRNKLKDWMTEKITNYEQLQEGYIYLVQNPLTLTQIHLWYCIHHNTSGIIFKLFK